MKQSLKALILSLLIGLIYSLLHFTYNSKYYQTDKLSAQQKKEIYYSEGAFYYSFYDKIISAKTLSEGLSHVFFNETHEAPKSINAHERFNISYEIGMGILYRASRALGFNFEPTHFYDAGVFFINGFLLSSFLFIAFVLTQSLWSMLLPPLLFIIHQQEATRVLMNTPLRENIGIVFVFAHFLSFYFLLKSKSLVEKISSTNKLVWPFDRYQIAFVATTFLQLIFWQFTQFIIIVEIIAVLLLFSFKHLKKYQLSDYFILLIGAWFVTVIYLMGSVFVLNSLFFFISLFFLGLFGLSNYKKIKLESVTARSLFCFVGLIGGVLIHFSFNFFLGQQNDSHIFNFILAQFKDSSNFHAKLYLCDEAFNKMTGTQTKQLFKGGFLPLYLIGLIFILKTYAKSFFIKKTSKINTGRTYLFYITLLTIGFSLIAYNGKRFSAIALPLSLPLISYFVFLLSQKLQIRFGIKQLFAKASIAIFITLFLMNKSNIFERWYYYRPVPDQTMTQLIEMINTKTEKKATIAASMPLSSNLVLLTDRKIIIHPQYENIELRKKVKEFYKIYGNYSEKEMHKFLSENNVSHLVSEAPFCYFKSTNGCVMQELINEGKSYTEPQFCDKDFSKSKYFELVFDNRRFKVLKLK